MSFVPQGGAPHSPYIPPPNDPYAPRKASGACTALWVLLGGGGLLVVLLCCGGGAALLFFTRDFMQAEVKNQLRDNPKLREHLGELESVELDFSGTVAVDDDQTFRYNVRGSKGSGELTVVESPDDSTIVEATL